MIKDTYRSKEKEIGDNDGDGGSAGESDCSG